MRRGPIDKRGGAGLRGRGCREGMRTCPTHSRVRRCASCSSRRGPLGSERRPLRPSRGPSCPTRATCNRSRSSGCGAGRFRPSSSAAPRSGARRVCTRRRRRRRRRSGSNRPRRSDRCTCACALGCRRSRRSSGRRDRPGRGCRRQRRHRKRRTRSSDPTRRWRGRRARSRWPQVPQGSVVRSRSPGVQTPSPMHAPTVQEPSSQSCVAVPQRPQVVSRGGDPGAQSQPSSLVGVHSPQTPCRQRSTPGPHGPSQGRSARAPMSGSLSSQSTSASTPSPSSSTPGESTQSPAMHVAPKPQGGLQAPTFASAPRPASRRRSGESSSKPVAHEARSVRTSGARSHRGAIPQALRTSPAAVARSRERHAM